MEVDLMSEGLKENGSSMVESEELNKLLAEELPPNISLARLVEMVRRRFHSDVCSVYLLDPNRSLLVLAATDGLLPDAVGRVRMSLKEGLVGLVAEQLRPLVLEQAEDHPRFKYFPETGEELYRSFVGVPIVELGVLQGVLVIQMIAARLFSATEVHTLVETASKVSPIVSDLRAQSQFFSQAYDRTRRLTQNLWVSWDNERTQLIP